MNKKQIREISEKIKREDEKIYIHYHQSLKMPENRKDDIEELCEDYPIRLFNVNLEKTGISNEEAEVRYTIDKDGRNGYISVASEDKDILIHTINWFKNKYPFLEAEQDVTTFKSKFASTSEGMNWLRQYHRRKIYGKRFDDNTYLPHMKNVDIDVDIYGRIIDKPNIVINIFGNLHEQDPELFLHLPVGKTDFAGSMLNYDLENDNVSIHLCLNDGQDSRDKYINPDICPLCGKRAKPIT